MFNAEVQRVLRISAFSLMHSGASLHYQLSEKGDAECVWKGL